MTKEELLKLLREHLSVSVSVDEHSRIYSNSTGVKVSVKIKFEDEVVAEGDDYCTLSRD